MINIIRNKFQFFKNTTKITLTIFAIISSLFVLILLFSGLRFSFGGWYFTGLNITNVSSETFTFHQKDLGSKPSVVFPKNVERPKNIIVFIADGMGFPQLSLAMAINNTAESQSVWDRFVSTGWHRPHPYNGFLTDSAASATALATGVATRNGSVGVGPDGKSATNLFELADKKGYRTGIVTDSYIWDATPAGFVAHSANRSNGADLLQQMIDFPLEILFGELEDVGEDGVPDWETTVNLLERKYTILDTGLEANDCDLSSKPLAAVFEEHAISDLQSTPTLSKMVEVALDCLPSHDKPFLLLVESEEPDSASHRYDFTRLVKGMKSIEHALNIVLDFAAKDEDTIVVFTSDHETGGLVLDRKNSENQEIQATWAAENHSGSVVPIMAFGPGSEHFSGTLTNQGVGQLLHSMLK
jgi:alkaline phosphatase